MSHLQGFLESELSKHLSDTKNMEHHLVNICNSFYEQPVHSFSELKQRNTKVKGDIFELHGC